MICRYMLPTNGFKFKPNIAGDCEKLHFTSFLRCRNVRQIRTIRCSSYLCYQYIHIPIQNNYICCRYRPMLLTNGFPFKPNIAGDCDSLQFTQSMEIDPARGYMWIIDVGRTNIFPVDGDVSNKCPPKLVIWDLNHNLEIRRHVFPNDVVSHTTNFINDIVVDPPSGFAYISDASGKGAVVVYDYANDRSHRLEHPTMNLEPNATVVTINGKNSTHLVPIDGIALSADRTQLFYCALAGFYVHQLPTEVAKQPGANLEGRVRTVGRKSSQSDGLAFARSNLYYGIFSLNSVYKWEIAKDMSGQNVPIDKVTMATQTQLARDDVRMQWQDTFGFDHEGYLWVMANRLQQFQRGDMDFTGKNGANFVIWKIFVNESSYIVE